MSFENGLTAAETERLTMLAEEAAEVVKAVTKILRHGYAASHPDKPHRDNKQDLMDELLDLVTIHALMVTKGDLIAPTIDEMNLCFKRKRPFMHHQPPRL
jgi:NTP pyrophosphatase (non-canonical NTP hydrolase)